MILRDEAKNMQVTVAQAVALHKVYERFINDTPGGRCDPPMSFEDWLFSKVSPSFEPGLLMVEHAGMQLGIEKDGYTHS